MNQFTEEHIFSYLDQTLAPPEIAKFEQEMQNDPNFKSRVDHLRTSHLYFLESQIEAAPEKLSDQIMVEVATLSKNNYYRPSGLFNSTTFLLISGVLTAIVAFLSLVNTGYVDFQSFTSGMNEMGIFKEWNFSNVLISKRVITNSMLVIYGVLAMALLDRLILNPLFRRKAKQLGLN